MFACPLGSNPTPAAFRGAENGVVERLAISCAGPTAPLARRGALSGPSRACSCRSLDSLSDRGVPLPLGKLSNLLSNRPAERWRVTGRDADVAGTTGARTDRPIRRTIAAACARLRIEAGDALMAEGERLRRRHATARVGRVAKRDANGRAWAKLRAEPLMVRAVALALPSRGPRRVDRVAEVRAVAVSACICPHATRHDPSQDRTAQAHCAHLQRLATREAGDGKSGVVETLEVLHKVLLSLMFSADRVTVTIQAPGYAYTSASAGE
jgi:hypothetical protein